MTILSRFAPVAVFVVLASCSDEPRSGAPANGGSESGNDVSNPFPADRGDVAAATDRAAARGGGQTGAPPDVTTSGGGTLVLYDQTGPWGWLGELYAMNVGALAGHFGPWKAKPVRGYTAGELGAYVATIYVGSTFDEPLPTAFLDDVLADVRPVVWIDSNIWQLSARAGSLSTAYGFQPSIFDTSDVAKVNYKSTALTRYLPNGAGIMTIASVTTATVLAEAVRSKDGTKFPWAIRGKKLTYIGENPMAFVTANDRYLAFADLLFDALAPDTAEQHRALVRIEDVSANTDPKALRACADYLAGEKIPFSVATIPKYLDPNGFYTGGKPVAVSLHDAPAVADALRYMVSKGGTIVLHGYTHQDGAKANPYNGVSEDDFEFYTTHVDANNFVVYDGPIAADSEAWAAERIVSGLDELRSANLPAPIAFEYPHYAGSVPDSTAVRASFTNVYHRGLFFSGQLSGAAIDYGKMIGVMYPYTSTDLFGFRVIPENLGSYALHGMNHNAPRLVTDLVATAHANRVVRDGFASFYFHPYYDVSVLKDLVQGIRGEGYTFVDPGALQ